MNRIIIRALLALAILAAVPGFAAAPQWQHGTVLGQETQSVYSGSYEAWVHGVYVNVPTYRNINTLTVETECYRYVWQEAPMFHGNVILPINGTVNFYQDGSSFIIIDIKNRKHKFSILSWTQVGDCQ